MKRFYLALAMLAALPAAASAQTILNEGFETTSTDQYSPNFPDGWSTVDSYTGNNDRYRWNIYYYEKGTMTGTHCASVDSPMFTGSEDGGEGPREEILLTPELNLDNTYQLSFDWMAASKAAIDEGKYDLQVRSVTDGNVEGAETIWSFNNATQLKENGNVFFCCIIIKEILFADFNHSKSSKIYDLFASKLCAFALQATKKPIIHSSFLQKNNIEMQ